MLASASFTIVDISDGFTKFYQYVKTTSNTTAPTTGWSADMPASEAGKFIWSREGYALTYKEVSAWGNAMCLTGATGGKGDPGVPGLPGSPGVDAQSFQIVASPPTFALSSRGIVAEAKTISLYCVKSNIPENAAVTWSSIDLTIATKTGNSISVIVPKGFASSEISISCVVVGFPKQTLKIMGVKAGDSLPIYLGVLTDSDPAIADFYTLVGGKFIPGDFFLYQTNQGNYPKWYDGVSWNAVDKTTPNYSQICSTVLGDSLKHSNTILSMSAIYSFIQTLIANDAFIGFLESNFIEVKRAIYAKYSKEGMPPASEYGFHLDANGKFQAKSATLQEASVTGNFTSEEFSTQKANGSGAHLVISITSADFTHACVLSEFIEPIMDKVTKVGTIITSNGYYAYHEANITGNIGGNPFSRIMFYNVSPKCISARVIATLSGGTLSIAIECNGDPGYAIGSDNVTSGYEASYSDGWKCKPVPQYALFESMYNAIAVELPLNTTCKFTGLVTIKHITKSTSFGHPYYPTSAGSINILNTDGGKILVSEEKIVFYSLADEYVGEVDRNSAVVSGTSMDINVESAIRGIKTMNISPTTGETYDIGASNKPFRNGHFIKVEATQVWGAVAN